MCMHEVWNTCSSVSKVDVSWLSAFKMNTIEILWFVKGYHYFKVKPNPGEVMQVRREYNNSMSVLHEGGEQVGRVPANLCGAFRQLLEIGYTRKIICIYTGSIGHCQNPHVHQPYVHGTRTLPISRSTGIVTLTCFNNFVCVYRALKAITM